MDQRPTRVVVVSDQAIYLRGLASLVMSMPKVSLVGEARSGEEALQLCRLSKPEVVLLDLKEPLDYRREVAHQVHQQLPNTKTILLIRAHEENQAVNQPDEPNLYFCSRDVSDEEFKAAVEQVRRETVRREHIPGTVRPVFQHALTAEAEEEPQESRRLGSGGGLVRNQELLTRELVMAGKIQADILPEEPPKIPGWEIAARLEPARETSGDFYDFIPVGDRKLGIVVADVTDKGMGAALFMALSSTLLRTYATRFPTLPALTLNEVSKRILSDTRGNMFVTAFFGIMEPYTGRLVYANAGHPPGYLISSQRGKVSIDYLRPTGMSLGVTEQAEWRQKNYRLAPGDYLILYTDGITEAQNPQGDFFGEERLLDVALSKVGCPARDMENALLEEVHRFVGNVPRQDDIALIVVHREKAL